jgi:hypothetical protein
MQGYEFLGFGKGTVGGIYWEVGRKRLTFDGVEGTEG